MGSCKQETLKPLNSQGAPGCQITLIYTRPHRFPTEITQIHSLQSSSALIFTHKFFVVSSQLSNSGGSFFLKKKTSCLETTTFSRVKTPKFRCRGKTLTQMYFPVVNLMDFHLSHKCLVERVVILLLWCTDFLRVSSCAVAHLVQQISHCFSTICICIVHAIINATTNLC